MSDIHPILIGSPKFREPSSFKTGDQIIQSSREEIFKKDLDIKNKFDADMNKFSEYQKRRWLEINEKLDSVHVSL